MKRPKYTVEMINNLIGVKESYNAPDKLLKIMFNKSRREQLMKDFLEVNPEVSYDWFSEYFQSELSRPSDKQDITPASLSNLMAKLSETKSPSNASHNNLDIGACTGSLTISKWNEDRLNDCIFTYMPSNYFYECEEIDDRAIPFLIFNLAIRGMNATIWHGNSLDRTCKGVILIENAKDDFLSFSDVNVMPYNEEVKEQFNISEWSEQKYPNHIETEMGEWEYNVLEQRKKNYELFENFENKFKIVAEHQRKQANAK